MEAGVRRVTHGLRDWWSGKLDGDCWLQAPQPSMITAVSDRAACAACGGGVEPGHHPSIDSNRSIQISAADLGEPSG